MGIFESLASLTATTTITTTSFIGKIGDDITMMTQYTRTRESRDNHNKKEQYIADGGVRDDNLLKNPFDGRGYCLCYRSVCIAYTLLALFKILRLFKHGYLS
jgi:hypothetical protein